MKSENERVGIKLSDDLRFWRAERPDEWTMDRFIIEAEKLENQLQNTSSNSDYVVQASPSLKSCANCFWKCFRKDKHLLSVCNGCHDENNWEEHT